MTPNFTRCHPAISLLACILMLPLSSCSSEPQTVSISATTFNYSPDYLIDVWVNGKPAASLIKPAKAGEIKGGGGFICCAKLNPADRFVEVKVQLPDEKSYTVQAPVFPQPWPEIANYAVVHILPSRKALVEIYAGAAIPDPTRLNELIKKFEEDSHK